MRDYFSSLQLSFRVADFIDIVIISFFVYRALLLIKGTRAMQMLTGLGLLGIAYILSSTFELFATHWILSHFFDALILLIIVLFQDDLRRALTQVGKNPFFASQTSEESREMIFEISSAASNLAQAGIGGLIVIERETGLKNFIDTGSRLDSSIRAELIASIFQPQSVMHDGAIIISGGKLAAAGCFLPLARDPIVNKNWGTRHRAAIGISEDSDAVIVLISEESRSVCIVKGGRVSPALSESEVRDTLSALLGLGEQLSVKGIRNWLAGPKRS